MIVDIEGLELTFGQLKQDRGKRTVARRVRLPFINDHPNICPASNLQYYLNRTKIWRDINDEYIFISVIKPHKQLTSQRIAKLLLQSMAAAGVDTQKWKAHSVRGASATNLLDKGTSVEDVMRAGRWGSFLVFRDFYDRSTRNVNVIRVVTNR